jgi:hypothetical protein
MTYSPKARRTQSHQKPTPKAIQSLADEDGDYKYPLFSLALLSRVQGSCWNWTGLNPDESREILDFLTAVSTKNWAEIKEEQTESGRSQHHYHRVQQLCKEAQTLLQQGELDDLQMVYRFGVSGRKRLWGYRYKGIFHVLWWDPEQSVYPTIRHS